MKVRELIQDLLLADPEHEVWVATDAEGNDFKPIAEDPYDPATVEDGEVYLGDDTGVAPANAIVLWPSD